MSDDLMIRAVSAACENQLEPLIVTVLCHIRAEVEDRITSGDLYSAPEVRDYLDARIRELTQ